MGPPSVLNFTDPQSQIVFNGTGAQLFNLTINNTGSQKHAAVNMVGTINSLISTVTLNGWETGIESDASFGLTIQYVNFSIGSGNTGIESIWRSVISVIHCKFIGQGNGWGITHDPHSNNITVTKSSFSLLDYGVLTTNLAGLTPWPGIVNVSESTFDHCYGAISCNYLQSVTFDKNTVTNGSYGPWIKNNQTSVVSNNKIVAPIYYGVLVGKDAGAKVASPSSQTISGNTITNVGSGYYGIYLEGSNITVSNNTLTGSTGAYYGINVYNLDRNGKNIVFNANNISGFKYGIASQYCHDTKSTQNTISNIQTNGIYSYHDTQLTANGNKLSNCGLASGAYSVIYVIGADSDNTNQNYTAKNNSYTASSTPNLSYFVYVDASDNNDVHISGNTTNTLLANYP